MIYQPRDETDAEEYSKLVGYETYKAKSISRSSGRGSSRSQNQSDQRRAVMLPQELQLMPQSDCIVLMGNTRPIYAKKIIYWQDPIFIKRANLPFPIVPTLAVSTTQRIIGNTPVAQYMTDEAMATADARDVTNAADVFNAILRNLVTPDSSPEFVAGISQCVRNNLGIDAMPIFKSVLNNS